MNPLKPVMAALLAAAVATFLSLPGAADDSDCTGTLKVAATDPVNALTCLVKTSAEARAGIGERLAQFIQGKMPGRQYLSHELLDDSASAVEAAKAWPEANQETPAKVAVLYFVAGPGSAGLPDWAKVAALKGKLKSGLWSDRLAAALTKEGWSGKKQVAKSDAAAGTTLFLDAAAESARKVMDGTWKKKNRGIGKAPAVPADAASGSRFGRSGLAFGEGFSSETLYHKGAKFTKIQGKGDEGYRELSMKIYTVRGDDGSLQNMIGIVDITDPKAPYKPYFIPVTASGKKTFKLRDGGRSYELNIDGDRVTLGREGATPGEGTSTMDASLNSLYALRAEQVRSAGTMRVPDPSGPEYYVLGEGNVLPGVPDRDARGSLLFFPKSGLGDPKAVPTAMCDVAMVDKDGVTVPVNWKPELAGGTDLKGKFHMVFDDKTKTWKVAAGAGDPDPIKKAADEKAAAEKAAAAKAAKPGAAQSGAAPEAPDDLGVPADGEPNPPCAGDITSESAPFKIYEKEIVPGKPKALCVEAGDKHSWLNGPLRLAGGALVIKEVLIDGSVLYLYLDEAGFGDILEKKKKPHVVGQYSKSGGMDSARSLEIAHDIMRTYLKLDDSIFGQIDAKVGEFAKGSAFTISANKIKKKMIVTLNIEGAVNKECQLWPDASKGCTSVSAAAGAPNVKGELCPQVLPGQDASGMTKVLYHGGDAVKAGPAAGTQSNEACLYVHTPKGKPGYYELDLHYNSSTSYPSIKSAALFRDIFGQDKPSAFSYGSVGPDPLRGDVPGDNPAVRAIKGSNRTRGGYGFFYQPPGARDKDVNCIGVVVWWGVDPATALAACKADQF